MKSRKGKFTPKFPKKYKGDPTNIVYRSSWELRFMKYLDNNPNILEWGSEELPIPYVSPLDNMVHRYFPDFIVKAKQLNGTVKTLIIEIKPHSQTQEPPARSNKSKSYITEVATWGVNSAKWKAAQTFCESKGWDFKILTEYELGIKAK